MRFWFFIVLLRISVANAQTPAYLHYGMPEGLPGNTVYCGIQDKEGILWFGTDKGLVRFDGIRFTVYGIKDGLPDPEVLGLHLDLEGRLWIFCFQQKPCYRLKGRIYTEKEDPRLEIVEDYVWIDVFETPEHGLWFFSSLTSYRFLNEKFEKMPFGGVFMEDFDGQLYSFQAKAIRPMEVDQKSGKRMFGDFISYFSIKAVWSDNRLEERFYMPYDLDKGGFKGGKVSGNKILMSFSKSRWLFQQDSGRFKIIARKTAVDASLFVDRSGRFWACLEKGGVVCFDNQNADLSNPKVFFSGQRVNKIFEDNFGAFWFCTAGNGIFALLPNAPVLLNPVKKNITALAYDSSGYVIFGDNLGMVDFWPPHPNGPIQLGNNKGFNIIRQIQPLDINDFFIATDDHVFRYKNSKISQIKNSKNANKCIQIDGNKIWYGSASGLGTVDLTTMSNNTQRAGRVTAMAKDREGTLWIASANGLYSQKDDFHYNWAEKFPILKSRINCIAPDEGNKLWISSPTNGLLCLQILQGEIKAIENFSSRHGNRLENVNYVFPENNRIWLATNHGVFGLVDGEGLYQFGIQDGLAADDVNAVLVIRDTLWAATTGGLSRLVLKSKNEVSDFTIGIASIHFFDGSTMRYYDFLDSLPLIPQTILPSNASLVRIELTAPYFRSRGQLRFQCRVVEDLPPVLWWTPRNLMRYINEGFRPKIDTVWVNDGTFDLGIQLPSGFYKIYVDAVTASNLWSKQPAYWQVFKKPKWYGTIWVMLVVILISGLGIWRLQHARSANRRLNLALSEMQLQALRAQINPHFVGNSINALQQFFYPPDPFRASEYISIFNRLLRKTLEYSERNFIEFKEELQYDSDYLNMIKLRLGDRFEFEITGFSNVDPQMPFPSMFLQPILENATMHGLAEDGISLLQLDFYISQNKLVCTVTDNGAGYKTIMERRKNASLKRLSKGMNMIRQKAEILQQIYNVPIEINFLDLSELGQGKNGTQVALSIDMNIVNTVNLMADNREN